MKRLVVRWLPSLVVLIAVAGSAVAQSLSVTTPTNGAFLGTSNQVKFLITNIDVETNVRVVATGPGGAVFTNEGDFTPNADLRIDSQLSLNINTGSPEGAYTIVVTAKRKDTGFVFGTATINVQLDVTKPKFLQFNPLNGTFVRGVVLVNVLVLEPNFKDYRVQANGNDIPNGTGTTLINDTFSVTWDTSGIQFDGAQSINIRLRDEANNEDSRTISVTLDRIAPSVAIVQPRADVPLRSRSNVSVAVDIADASTSSVDVTGIEIIARTMSGGYLAHVARQSYRNTSGNIMRWAGRLRYSNRIPAQFKIVVNVIDRAGNVASTQEVVVNYR